MGNAARRDQAEKEKSRLVLSDLAPVLKHVGYGRRILSLDDFDFICDDQKILVTERPMKWKGLFTVCEGVSCIALNAELDAVSKPIVAFHELGHYFTPYPPALGFFCTGTLSKTEYMAHRFAAIALIPLPLMKQKTFTEIQEEYSYPTEFMFFRQRVYDNFKV